MFAQVMVNGLLQGGFYACIGVSFSIVFGIMKIINLAQGTQVILGAYITYATSHLLGLDPFFTLPLNILPMLLKNPPTLMNLRRYLTPSVLRP